MNLSRVFIERPVATSLLTLAIALTGMVGFVMLPVSPLPQIDFPTISVQAQLPGASAEIMASSVATPLERQFGRIAGVTEMTSSSYLGTTSVTLQFDLDRDINGAARDVQAAINAARSYLPSNLPANPTYRKVNPADAPIMILALTSSVYGGGALYDAASTVIEQRLSQIEGVGQVSVGGSSLPSVRVEVNPLKLSSHGFGFPDLAGILSSQNSNSPKGQLSGNEETADILSNDQLTQAEGYHSLVIGYQGGAGANALGGGAVHLSDVASVFDGIQNTRSSGYMNGKPSVLLIIFRAPGANIIDTVDRIRGALPALQASIPAAIEMSVVLDRTTTIRASVKDVESTLMLSIALVIGVVFFFLRDWRATLIPSVAVPVSLVGTFGIMDLLHFSIDNLSLMALTVSTGFVVDDAIVVIENIARSLEKGLSPRESALVGAQEVGFTVLSISISLIAVFIPILLMGGIVGRLLREFAVTLSVAIAVSLGVSLTATPMMCSRLLKSEARKKRGRLYQASERFFDGMLSFYEKTLTFVLGRPKAVLAVLLLTICANICLLVIVPKGFFPEQDNGTIFGGILGPQDASFQRMNKLTLDYVDAIRSDPAVEHVMAFTGGSGATDSGFVYIGLKNLEERKINASEVIARLRPKLMSHPGAGVFLQAGQDVRIGGRQSNAQYQYTIQSESVAELTKWGPVLLQEMRKTPGLTDVNSDQQNNGLKAFIKYDRKSAGRLGITAGLLDDTLYDAFGQALVSTIYMPQNQYYVVMEAAPPFTQSPKNLEDIYIHSPDRLGNGGNGSIVPLRAVTRLETQSSPLAVNHQGLLPSVTVSFNLAPGVALGEASSAIEAMERRIGLPSTIQGMFSGTLEAFQASLSTQPLLIVTAILAVYIVLGILYESFVHPLTILSTIPSAGVGAALVLILFHMELSIVALIGMILLIGIVKKNAILMIDFAIAAERSEGKSPKDAIFEACLLRFRPILMTTLAALFGALPLAFGRGMGAELRRPLGLTIMGGLIFSQVLTLYTTPIVYLELDRMRLAFKRWFPRVAASSIALIFALHLTGCSSVGPKYSLPGVLVADHYKEIPEKRGGAIWRAASPREGVLKGKWWETFGDPELNALEEQVNVSNQNIAASFESFLQARALIGEARAQFFPTLSVAPALTSQGGQAVERGGTSSVGTYTQYSVPLQASWAPDLWGRISSTVRANVANAQVSLADLESERLTEQADLAIAYFELKSQDSLQDLYEATVRSYEETLKLTQSLYGSGINSDLSVAQAEAQLKTAQAQETQIGIARSQYEHAIALLAGKSASSFALSHRPLLARAALSIEPIPAGIPSELLERRPDIAAAERAMAAANAQIGVAVSAYYPSLTLSGAVGMGANSYSGLLAVPQFVWSLGATLAETIFDGGARSATVDQYQASYRQSVAAYRQTVLTAFQQVEDALSGVRILSREIQQQNEAIEASRRSLKIALGLYQAGIDPYLNVLSAQVALFSNQQTEVELEMQRLTTQVQLIEALGGGWDRRSLSVSASR